MSAEANNGTYVMQIPEGKKIKAEVVRSLMPEQIKEFKRLGIWPELFDTNRYLNNSYNYTGSERGFIHGKVEKKREIIVFEEAFAYFYILPT